MADPRPYTTSDFDFDLPEASIAQEPAEPRDSSRLMVVERAEGGIRDRVFSELPELMAPGDALVLNETRVFPARLLGTRAGGGAAEVFLLHPEPGDPALWTALVRPGARLRPGRRVRVARDFEVEVLELLPGGERRVRLVAEGSVEAALERYGAVPLPPYVRRPARETDRERYQTVYARQRGSVAAPTAGLHFTPTLLERIRVHGVRVVPVLLHVGLGTFRPVETEDPAAHAMHREWFQLPAAAADALNETRAAGGAVWAVGTTSVRTLESAADEAGRLHEAAGWTNLFIRPPYRFRAVDRLVTNFHLPRSTLLMLVSAFAGRELTLRAYREAVSRGYRFFSYGDAMAIL